MVPKPDNIPLDTNYVELIKLRSKYRQLQALAAYVAHACATAPELPYAVEEAALALGARHDLLEGAP